MAMTMTPEVQEATARLKKIPRDFVTSSFREAVLAAARAQTLRRELAEAKALGHSKLKQLLDEGSMPVGLAGELASIEWLEQHLPSASIDQTLIEEALQLAEQRINASPVPEVPVMTCDRELAAWRSLDNINLPPPAPVVTPEEAIAVQAIKDLRPQRDPVVRTVEAWRAGLRQKSLEVLNHLAAAGGTLQLIADYTTRHKEVSELVRRADAARAAAGLRWIPPTGVTTPAIAELAAAQRS